MKKRIEYMCEGCNAGRCRAITEDDGYPPDSCLYGGGTKEWRLVEEPKPDRCPTCGSTSKRDANWDMQNATGCCFPNHVDPWHDTQKHEKCVDEIRWYTDGSVKENCITPCPQGNDAMVGSVACQGCRSFGGFLNGDGSPVICNGTGQKQTTEEKCGECEHFDGEECRQGGLEGSPRMSDDDACDSFGQMQTTDETGGEGRQGDIESYFAPYEQIIYAHDVNRVISAGWPTDECRKVADEVYNHYTEVVQYAPYIGGFRDGMNFAIQQPSIVGNDLLMREASSLSPKEPDTDEMKEACREWWGKDYPRSGNSLLFNIWEAACEWKDGKR